MKIQCFDCGAFCTNELPGDTIFRAIATCPECVSKDNEELMQLRKENDKLRDDLQRCVNQLEGR